MSRSKPKLTLDSSKAESSQMTEVEATSVQGSAATSQKKRKTTGKRTSKVLGLSWRRKPTSALYVISHKPDLAHKISLIRTKVNRRCHGQAARGMLQDRAKYEEVASLYESLRGSRAQRVFRRLAAGHQDDGTSKCPHDDLSNAGSEALDVLSPQAHHGNDAQLAFDAVDH